MVRDVSGSVCVVKDSERKRHKSDRRKVHHYPEAGVGLSNHRTVYSVIIVSYSRGSSGVAQGNRHGAKESCVAAIS
jgi:hypothetical protein